MIRKEIIQAYVDYPLDNPDAEKYEINYANPRFFQRARTSCDYFYSPENNMIAMSYIRIGKKIWKPEDHKSIGARKEVIEDVVAPVDEVITEDVVVDQQDEIVESTASEEPTIITHDMIKDLPWDELRELVLTRTGNTVRSKKKAFELLGVEE